MNQLQNTIPAETDKPCSCCGRNHRKLFLVDGHWLGRNCAEDYKIYRRNSDVKSPYWKGYERKYTKVAKMVEAHNSQLQRVEK